MLTVATVCDDIVECVDSQDETFCQNKDKFSMYFILLPCSLVIAMFTALKIFSHLTDDSQEEAEVELNLDIDEKTFGHLHKSEHLNVFLMKLKIFRSITERRKVCLEIMELELQSHGNNIARVLCCLHNNLDPEMAQMLLDFYFPGVMETLLQKFPGIENRKKDSGVQRHIYMEMFFTILFILQVYSDVFKDCYIVVTIFYIIGGINSFLAFPTNFTSVLLLCLAASVLLPLLLSSLQLAIENPEMVFNMERRRGLDGTRIAMQFSVFIFLFLNPVFLLHVYQLNEKKKVSRQDERIVRALEKCRLVRIQFTKYIKMELSLEAFVQISIQILVLLLSITNTGTTGGLKTMFQNNSILGLSSETVLYFSILWSFHSSNSLHLRSISVEKVLLPLVSRISIYMWALFSTLSRVLSITTFFLPSFGLYDLLYHWKAEQVPFAIRWSAYCI